MIQPYISSFQHALHIVCLWYFISLLITLLLMILCLFKSLAGSCNISWFLCICTWYIVVYLPSNDISFQLEYFFNLIFLLMHCDNIYLHVSSFINLSFCVFVWQCIIFVYIVFWCTCHCLPCLDMLSTCMSMTG